MPTGIQHVSGSVVVPGKLCSGGSGSDQQHFPSCRSDQWASVLNPTVRAMWIALPAIVADAETGFSGVHRRASN
ncbi:hypothetical protein KCP78_21175 [Salmonella enterica subsp. enterica]|nr:hypothetical protein KCP78_21175 [Salmonella enterica subsp. enterica]